MVFTEVPCFKSDVVIYIPAYNCETTIVETIRSIPPDLVDNVTILIVDNNSSDKTVECVINARNNGLLPHSLKLIRISKNIGYAGSQKLAYSLIRRSAAVRWVIMLHGDGQYPSELLSKFVSFTDSKFGLIYGYRSKLSYRRLDETPLPTWAAIKLLGALESVVTGIARKEWHTGFNMYSVEFLRKLPLNEMTDTYHIDGQISFLAGALDELVFSIPIYKRYKGFDSFSGIGRAKYVFDVLRLMFEFRINRNALLMESLNPSDFIVEYTVFFEN